jgi:hypothetical protein
MLQSASVAASLASWKRAAAQQLAQMEQRLLHRHLPVQGQPIEAGDIPADVAAWFGRLRLLQGLPFNYLVPDERMLPRESIRFFWVDHLWVDCLCDGAFSIGRVMTADDQDKAVLPEKPPLAGTDRVSGFLLRSEVVAGWPGLLVDGFGTAPTPLDRLRMERLSENVLICLFAGDVRSVALYLKPESLHFGLDGAAGDLRSLTKKLRPSEGQEALEPLAVAWRDDDEKARVIAISKLAGDMSERLNVSVFSSAQFARQMIEAAPRITFNRA